MSEVPSFFGKIENFGEKKRKNREKIGKEQKIEGNIKIYKFTGHIKAIVIHINRKESIQEQILFY